MRQTLECPLITNSGRFTWSSLNSLFTAAIRPSAKGGRQSKTFPDEVEVRELARRLLYRTVSGYPPNATTYNSLVDACGKAGKLKHAFEVTQKMVTDGITATTPTFTSLISACGRAHHIDRAAEGDGLSLIHI